MKFSVKKRVIVIGGLYFPAPLGIDVINHGKISTLTPKTWKKRFDNIEKLIDNGEVHGVIIYLPTPFFLKASLQQYSEHFFFLLEILKKTKSLIISYEENLYGNFDYFDYNAQEYLKLDQVNKLINDSLKERKVITELNLKKGFKLDLDDPFSVFGIDDLNMLKILDETIKLDQEYKIAVEKIKKDKDIQASVPFDLFKLFMARERLIDSNNRVNEIQNFIDKLVNSEVELVSFREKSEIGFRIEVFLEEIVKDVFFNIYVSREQGFSEEFSGFLRIFEKYLQGVEGLNFTIDTQTTSNGVNYLFKTKDGKIDSKNFADAIKRFEDFMDICEHNPEIAIDIIIKSSNISKIKALELVNGLTKKYKRLWLDIKQEEEKLRLAIKHDVENSIQELQLDSPALLLLNQRGAIDTSLSAIQKNITSKRKKVDDAEVKLIDIISKYGDDNDIVDVRSNLEKLKDDQIDLSNRKTALSKLKLFLIKASNKALKHTEEIGVKVLTAYLESQIK